MGVCSGYDGRISVCDGGSVVGVKRQRYAIYRRHVSLPVLVFANFIVDAVLVVVNVTVMGFIGAVRIIKAAEGADWSVVGLRDEEQLGRSLAMSGSYVAVGGLQDIVHVYSRDEREEVELQGPKKSDFGRSLAMSSTHLVVGAPAFAKDPSSAAGGAVFVYVLDGDVSSPSASWTKEQVLYCGGEGSYIRCGASVGLSDTFLAMSAVHKESGTRYNCV